MFGLKQNKNLVGLDIGSSSIKAVELRRSKGELELVHAGIEPLGSAIVDVDAFALQNCYEYNYQPSDATTVALLNVGASVMNINVVKGANTLFTRDVPVGGIQYTDALQKELDLSFPDAEAFKLGKPLGTISDDAKTPVLQQVTEIITLEIQKTFDFFRA